MAYVSSKYSCSHFILQHWLSLFDFSNTKKCFFIKAIIHIVGTSKLSRINADVSFLASKLNIIFALLAMLSQYPATRLI